MQIYFLRSRVVLLFSLIFTVLLFDNPVGRSAESGVNRFKHPRLTQSDIELKDWILQLFSHVKPNREHQEFIQLSKQDSSYQYECHYLSNVSGSEILIPQLRSNPNARIMAFVSPWILRFDKNVKNIGIYNEINFMNIVFRSGDSKIFFSNIPGMTNGATRYFNYMQDKNSVWQKGGYGIITESDIQTLQEEIGLKKITDRFILTRLKGEEQEEGFLCLASAEKLSQ